MLTDLYVYNNTIRIRGPTLLLETDWLTLFTPLLIKNVSALSLKKTKKSKNCTSKVYIVCMKKMKINAQINKQNFFRFLLMVTALNKRCLQSRAIIFLKLCSSVASYCPRLTLIIKSVLKNFILDK